MPSKSSVKNLPAPEPSLLAVLFGPWKEAMFIFLGSSAFAVVFNAFYADGIELKVQPKKKAAVVPVQTPVSYPGLKGPSRTPPPRRTQAAPVPSDDIPRLSLAGAYARFQKKTAIFLDARKPEEYQAGHIPGALNFYGNELDPYAARVVPQLTDKAQEIVAYCHGGDCDLSLQVAKTLKEQGYRHVEIFQDGWPAWQKAAYPIQAGNEP